MLDSQTLSDRAEIADVVNLYHHLVDTPDATRLGEVFTADAVLDVSDYGQPLREGLETIIASFVNRGPSPMVVAHTATNLLIEVDGDTARCTSRCLAALRDGKVGAAVHSDALVRTAQGWRITRRVITMPYHMREPAEA